MNKKYYKDILYIIIMTITTIDKYNESLINEQKQINIIDYVKQVNALFNNIDIEFIDEFLELVSKNECCIHHNLLQKYSIISLNKGSTDIKRIIQQYEFEEHKDYENREGAVLRPQGGTSVKIDYYLHPRAFKICLIRSLKTKKYAKYYLLLEECIKYYNDYQNKLKEKYIIKLKDKINIQKDNLKIKDDKIDNLIQQNDKILHNNKELLEKSKAMEERSKKMEAQLNEALERLDLTNDKLDDTKEELEEAHEKIDTTNNTLNLVARKLDIAVDDRVIKPKQLSILEYLVIMKNNTATYKYYIIRGQKRYINKKINELSGYDEIKRFECVPNANILWCNIKEKLPDNIDFMGNKINLKNIDENNFINKVELIYNERKNVKV